MDFQPYIITFRENFTSDIFVIRLKPKTGLIPNRMPGQFAVMKNPAYQLPEAMHSFSFSSSPLEKDYVEFCIRVYGGWTKFLWDNANPGYELWLSDPKGFFIWDGSVQHAIFLVGGIGISPVMGMLRTIALTPGIYDLTLIYGSRTPETIAYREELDELGKKITTLKIVHVLSNLPPNDTAWTGYKGFITPDIIQKETNLSLKPIIFMTGPPPFLQMIQQELTNPFNIPPEQIKKEIISGMKPS